MFNKGVKEDLLKIKTELEKYYVCFSASGKVHEERGVFVDKHSNEELNGVLSTIDYFIKNSTECLAYRNIDFDKIKFGFDFGILYEKDNLGNNNKILPSSISLQNKVHFYTGNVIAYLNDKEQNIISAEDNNNFQGYVDYDKFIKDVNASGLSINGPQSYKELENLIRSGETCDMFLTVDLSKELAYHRLSKKI